MTTSKETARFDLVLGQTQVIEPESESPRIVCTASSDAVDLGLDRFLRSALDEMARAFPGMTIFLNHQYSVPEDVFGTVVRAEVVERGGHFDLDLEISVEISNPRAQQTFNQIISGTRLGISVGVLVLDSAISTEVIDGKKCKVLNIKSVKTLEASVVGIPANQRSWVQGVLKAASASLTEQNATLMSILRGYGGDHMALEDEETEDEEDAADEETEDEDEEDAADDEEVTGEVEQHDDEVDDFFVDAVWTTSYINNLADSAFATILDGGSKDSDGKTTPRSLRKLPHHDDSGKVDEAHLNNALSREPQTKMPQKNHKQAKAHLQRHKNSMGLALDPEFADYTDDMLAELDPAHGADHFQDVTLSIEVEVSFSDDPNNPAVESDEPDEDDNANNIAAVFSTLRAADPNNERQWYTIKAAEESTEENDDASDTTEILIYDVIGHSWFGGVTAEDFVQALQDVTSPKINLRINSPGGAITDAVAIKNALVNHPAEVTAHIDGMAASAASFIAFGSKEIIMEPGSMMMIHDPWSMMAGNADAFTKEAEVLNKFADNIAKMYANQAGGTPEDWRAKMRDETWYTDEEAVDAGLANRVGGESSDSEKQKFAPVLMSLFKHLPENAKTLFAEVDPAVMARFDVAKIADLSSGVVTLTKSLQQAQAELSELQKQLDAKDSIISTHDADWAEANALFRTLMDEVTTVLDTVVIPRKIAPEATFNELSSKYPWLDSTIINQIAKFRERA